MAKAAFAYCHDGEIRARQAESVCWELRDGRFSVRLDPWPPRPGPTRLLFPHGPDLARLRYRIHTAPPRGRLLHLLDDTHPEEGLVYIDESHDVPWRAFPRKGSQGAVLPFEATVELPAGKVWLEFRVDQDFRPHFRSIYAGLCWELDVAAG
jgi:hypothetical protein